MSNIYGIKGFGRLAEGYPVNINDMDVKPFTVDAAAPEAGIKPGALLIYTDTYNSFTTTDPVKTKADYANKVAGIALATNVKLDTVFPQGGSVNWLRGQAAGCAVKGEIAVTFDGTAPKQGAPVYYDITKGAFTAAAGTSNANLELTNMRFTGNTEGTLTVVNILY